MTQVNVNELKPCPFCGGEANGNGHTRYSRPLHDTHWLDGSPVTEAFYAHCMSCGAISRSGIVNGYQTKDEAITAWNTRATPVVEHEKAQIAAWLRAENGKCDCAALEKCECACGGWDEYKSRPLLDIAQAIEAGEHWK